MTGRSSIYLFLIVVLIVGHVRASCLFRTCCTTADDTENQPRSNNEPSRIRKALQTLNQIRSGGRVATGRSAPKTDSWENLAAAERITTPICEVEMMPLLDPSPLAASWIHSARRDVLNSAVFKGEISSPTASRTFAVGRRAFFNMFYVFGFGIKYEGIYLNSMFQESYIYLDANMMSIFRNTSVSSSQLSDQLKEIELSIQLSREHNRYALAFEKIKDLMDFSMTIYLNDSGRIVVDSHTNEANVQAFYFPFGQSDRTRQLSVAFLESQHFTDLHTNGLICFISCRNSARIDTIVRGLQRDVQFLIEDEEKWFNEFSGKLHAGELVLCGKVEPKIE